MAFNNIEKIYKKDFKGRSPAFYRRGNDKILNAFDINFLKKYSKENNIDSRVCLHKLLSKKSQIMLINKIKNQNDKKLFFKNYFIKIFILISGEIHIKFKKKRTIILNNKKTFFLIVKPNEITSTYSNTSSSCYLEILIINEKI